jgi:predicted RNA-binding Zn-ribbon protein involved in translation (DUF1610 family)
MPPNNRRGRSPLERQRSRYENTETKCPECGYVNDANDDWASQSNGQQIVYHYVCPSCGAEREHVFQIVQ